MESTICHSNQQQRAQTASYCGATPAVKTKIHNNVFFSLSLSLKKKKNCFNKHLETYLSPHMLRVPMTRLLQHHLQIEPDLSGEGSIWLTVRGKLNWKVIDLKAKELTGSTVQRALPYLVKAESEHSGRIGESRYFVELCQRRAFSHSATRTRQVQGTAAASSLSSLPSTGWSAAHFKLWWRHGRWCWCCPPPYPPSPHHPAVHLSAHKHTLACSYREDDSTILLEQPGKHLPSNLSSYSLQPVGSLSDFLKVFFSHSAKHLSSKLLLYMDATFKIVCGERSKLPGTA